MLRSQSEGREQHRLSQQGEAPAVESLTCGMSGPWELPAGAEAGAGSGQLEEHGFGRFLPTIEG